MEKGGEGVILRKPHSPYIHGRSHSLFKFKALLADTEALVIGVRDGKPLLKLPNGITFTTEEGENTLKVQQGEVVTVTYTHNARQAVPLNPIIYRVRRDVNWEDVMRNHLLSSKSDVEFAGPTRKALGFAAKPLGYWSAGSRKNVRIFLEQFARTRNRDPLLASSWYSITSSELAQEEGATSLLSYYNGSLVKALFDLFPEITDLDASKFTYAPKKYWNAAPNRRKLFLDFADEIGFDPLVPNNWYSNYGKILETMGNHHILKFYTGSYRTALKHIFPELDLDRSKFVLPPKYWQDPQHHKMFFERFATSKGFDPLVPENWYSMKIDHFKATKNGMTVLSHYGGSHITALLALFPNIGLQPDPFYKLTPNLAMPLKDRKQFFIDFAITHKFDPLVADNWYSIRKEDIESTKHGRKVIDSHGRSHIQALFDLFPYIGLQRSKFKLPSNYWKVIENQKAFFEQFAASKGLNPLSPDAWYRMRYSDIYSTSKGKSVLACHGGSYTRALLYCFPNIGLQRHKFQKGRQSLYKAEPN